MMTKLPAYVVAGETGRWTEIMFRALSNRVAKRWRFVSFRGQNNAEWRGIVDVVAIRKDTRQPTSQNLKRGDLFDIILIQLKGGSARMPSLEDRRRLLEVKKSYKARAVVLFAWQRGRKTEFSTLERGLTWQHTSSREIFS